MKNSTPATAFISTTAPMVQLDAGGPHPQDPKYVCQQKGMVLKLGKGIFGGQLKRWRNRWFVIRDSELRCARSAFE